MTTEKAVLAGGCFWGMQDKFRRLRGVVSTRVGYTGSDLPNPSYGNHQGHAEAIEIVFDPAVVSYRAILERFFQVHDPTTYEQQGSDFGPSYRSAISGSDTKLTFTSGDLLLRQEAYASAVDPRGSQLAYGSLEFNFALQCADDLSQLAHYRHLKLAFLP
jgi:methionine-S-sulfoxide reductase